MSLLRILTWLATTLLSTAVPAMAAGNITIIEAAPDQGCILAVGFSLTTKDVGSLAEIRTNPYLAVSVCGSGGNTNSSMYVTWIDRVTAGKPWEEFVFVFYANLLPLGDKSKTSLADFDPCVIGPQHYEPVSSNSSTVAVRVKDQVLKWDGSSYWFSSNALYNTTVPDASDPNVFPRLPFDCHTRDDRRHLDSVLFNNPDVLKLLPNPYRDETQQKHWGGSNTTVTLQLATATDSAGLARRTAAPAEVTKHARTFGKPM